MRIYPRVIGVTSGAAWVVGEKQLNVAQSTLWGFVRSAILEYPDLQVSMVDIDPQSNESAFVSASVQHILAEVSSSEGHWDETAYRAERFVIFIFILLFIYYFRCFKNVIQDAGSQPLFQNGSTGFLRFIY